MKRVSKNIWLFIILCSFFTIDAQKKFSSFGDIFGLRVFVENNGQFDNKLQSDLKVRFAYETAQEHIYFTDKGPVYKLIRHYPMKERELERMERGKNVRYKEDKVRYVKVNWIGCNTDLKIVEEEVQNHYFTYGDRRFNSRTFRKITYKNVYDGIDIEYVIDQKTQHGIKYNVVVHPGADPELIRISYEGDVNRVMLRDGKILVYLGNCLWLRGRTAEARAIYAKALLTSPWDMKLEGFTDKELVEAIVEEDIYMAPLYGWLRRILPLIDIDIEEPHDKNHEWLLMIYNTIKLAEKARLQNDHKEMVEMRRLLK